MKKGVFGNFMSNIKVPPSKKSPLSTFLSILKAQASFADNLKQEITQYIRMMHQDNFLGLQGRVPGTQDSHSPVILSLSFLKRTLVQITVAHAS